MDKVNLYQITNLEQDKKGKPFGLCNKCFKKWEKFMISRDNLTYEKIGENTIYPCNECGKTNKK